MPIRLPSGDPCYFCGVAEGRHEKGVVEQTDATLTLVNARQYEQGQLLVLPRRHAPTLLDLDVRELARVMGAVRRAAQALVKTFDPDGITLYQNNGEASGQEIPHFHMHVVPRRTSGSRWGQGPPRLAVLEDSSRAEEVRIPLHDEQELAQRIRANLP